MSQFTKKFEENYRYYCERLAETDFQSLTHFYDYDLML